MRDSVMDCGSPLPLFPRAPFIGPPWSGTSPEFERPLLLPSNPAEIGLDDPAAAKQHGRMDPEVIAAIEKQATHELFAAQSYLSLAYWSDVRQYSGFAEFFLSQVEEEHEHAQRFLKFLADRDVVPKIGQVGAPRHQFGNLVEAAQLVYDLERANSAGINAAYEAALKAKDYAAQIMLHWFINEQIEEEAWSDKMLVKVQEATCPGALQMLDRHIVKELRKKSETP